MGLLRRPIEVPRRLAKISLTIFATPCHASSLSTFPHVFPIGSLSGQLNNSLGLGELLFPDGVCLSGVSGEAYERALAIRIGAPLGIVLRSRSFFDWDLNQLAPKTQG
jgi:hypothetical protein